MSLWNTADGSTLLREETQPWNVKGSEEAEIVPELEPRSEEIALSKTRYSALFGTTLLQELKSRDVGECVMATSLDAYQHGFQTKIIEEGVIETDLDYRHLYSNIFLDAGFLTSAKAVEMRLQSESHG